MALRVLELVLPNQKTEEVPELLKDIPVVQFWATETGETGSVVRILLDARQVEAVSDTLIEHLGTEENFRLISLAVEATVPAVEEEKDSAAQPATAPRQGDPQRISREELYEDLAEASTLTPIFLVMVALSTVVAAVGLIRGDVAIIIGAMVIAPLLGPNVGLALACTLGDLRLARRSLKAIACGAALAGALSMLLGSILRVNPDSPELIARTSASLSDVILAMAAGAAGSLAFTSGVPGVVVGVMVAVALLPPLVAAGLLLGSGHLVPAAGALMLVITNVTCVNLASVATFLLQKIRPRTWWEAERARQATRTAVTLWVVLLALLVALMFFGAVGLGG